MIIRKERKYEYASYCRERYVMVRRSPLSEENFTYIHDTNDLLTALKLIGRQTSERKRRSSHLLYDRLRKEVMATNSLQLLMCANQQIQQYGGILFLHPFEGEQIWIV